MKVFISSVRRGLETERDALPGLIRALGHEPLRFEDFTAQPVPSREACLRGVSEADVYVLLLGPHYGSALPDTGRSPTHEEHIAAQAKGIPRLVFRKRDVALDPEQAAFVEELEAYGTGLFRDSFADAVDLQAKIAEALRSVPSEPLVWQPLEQEVSISWTDEWSSPSLTASGSQVMVHAAPATAVRLSRRQLAELPDRIAEQVRAFRLASAATALQLGRDDDGAWAVLDATQRRWDEAQRGGLRGCRIDARAQRSAWHDLPSDSMGSIVDRTDLMTKVAESLRLLGAIVETEADRYVVAVELAASAMTVIDKIDRLGMRSSVSGIPATDRTIRLEPDETVTEAVFDLGAEDVAATLAGQLLDAFSRRD